MGMNVLSALEIRKSIHLFSNRTLSTHQHRGILSTGKCKKRTRKWRQHVSSFCKVTRMSFYGYYFYYYHHASRQTMRLTRGLCVITTRLLSTQYILFYLLRKWMCAPSSFAGKRVTYILENAFLEFPRRQISQNGKYGNNLFQCKILLFMTCTVWVFRESGGIPR